MKVRKPTPLGVEIKKALIDKGMTQVELADAIGADARYINLIIYGERSGKKYLEKIIDILELDRDDILSIA